jgi:hypothetical protein
MGTYIKKVLGYGLEMTEEQASDILNHESLKKLSCLDSVSYMKFLEGKYTSEPEVPSENLAYYLNDLNIGEMSKSKYRASDLITVVDNSLQVEENYEESSRTWAVITPLLTHREWKHNDDPIDYAENMYKYQNEETFRFDFSMKFFNQGFFPYDGGYINHATGEHPDNDMVTMLKRYLHTTSTQAQPENDTALRLMLASVGVSSVEEFKQCIHPAPPVSVTDIAEWSGIFNDPSTASLLRPVLLTYWS